MLKDGAVRFVIIYLINKYIYFSVAFFRVPCYDASMREESVDELKAQIAALKQALRSSETLRKTAESRHEKQVSAMTEEIKQYKALIERLKENFDIERYLNFAATTENKTPRQLEDLRSELDQTKPDASEPADRDLCASPEMEESKAKRRWGRVEGVRTCGRDMGFTTKLDKQTVECDIRKDIGDQAARDELVFVKRTVHHQVSFVPCHMRCRDTVCYLYRNTRTGELVQATPKEHDIIKGGKLANGLIAASIADKIVWGIPFYRQARRMGIMAGCNVADAQLLTRTFLSVSGFLHGMGDELYRQVVSSRSIHADETRILVIHDDANNKRRQGYFWMLSHPGTHPVSYCRFYPSRSKECAKELLSPCKAVAVQADGYAAYASVVASMNKFLATEIARNDGQEEADKFLSESGELLDKGILLVGCMAHARRRFFISFFVIYKNNPKSPGGETCRKVLDMIAELYRIEDEMRKQQTLTEDEFLRLRKEQAVPIIARLRSYAKQRQPLHTAEPKLSEAITYLLNQIDTIANYLECPDLTPDNNSQERLIKTVCTTRKASLFASTEEGARSWALMHSILQTAIINNLDPTAYLKMVIDRVAKANDERVLAKDMDWESLMPWHFSPQQLESVW